MSSMMNQPNSPNINHSFLPGAINFIMDTALVMTSTWLPLVFCPACLPTMHGDPNYPPCLRGKIRCQAHHKYHWAVQYTYQKPVCSCWQQWANLAHDENYAPCYESLKHPADTHESPLPPPKNTDDKNTSPPAPEASGAPTHEAPAPTPTSDPDAPAPMPMLMPPFKSPGPLPLLNPLKSGTQK